MIFRLLYRFTLILPLRRLYAAYFRQLPFILRCFDYARFQLPPDVAADMLRRHDAAMMPLMPYYFLIDAIYASPFLPCCHDMLIELRRQR